jgi:hypothetical protein
MFSSVTYTVRWVTCAVHLPWLLHLYPRFPTHDVADATTTNPLERARKVRASQPALGRWGLNRQDQRPPAKPTKPERTTTMQPPSQTSPPPASVRGATLAPHRGMPDEISAALVHRRPSGRCT